MNWASRAKTHFSDVCPDGTPKTPTNHLLGVMGAAHQRIPENEHEVLVVLGVGVPALCENEPAHDRNLLAALIEAAMRCCDHYKDGPAAREQMRADCLATPLHLQADLRDHFTQTYPERKS